ncbi:MAG: hypothetical protein MUC92_06495 [Fimbriimonadaceae bacterium]|nr:hypothetical protein [Fimbriimonadaceae bacterium]
MKVLVFLSEILSAKTLVPIVEASFLDPEITCDLVNDGFCSDFILSLNLPIEVILDDFRQHLDRRLDGIDCILMGKSYQQESEYILLDLAQKKGIPVVMVVPDMGIDVVTAKLKRIGTEFPWPLLLVADTRTCRSLGLAGVPPTRIVKFGNPYFDQHYAALQHDFDEWSGEGIGYFSTPFELDFKRGILPTDYLQKDYVHDLQWVADQSQQPLQCKSHPQVMLTQYVQTTLFEGSPLDMIRQIKYAVGSYSTTLLEAYSAGLPTFSYQPWEANIRQDVFEGRIPIVKTKEELLSLIRESQPRRTPGAFEPVTFNPGTSLQIALRHIKAQAATLA